MNCGHPQPFTFVMRGFLLLMVLSVCAACGSKDGPPEPATEAAGLFDSGYPEFATAEEAFRFLCVEENLLSYQGVVAGSEEYDVTLPSGLLVSNWLIDMAFGRTMRPFGEEAYPFLASHLNHPDEFVRVGVYACVNSAMHSRGIRYNALDFNPAPQPEWARIEAMEAFLAALDGER